MGTASFSVGRYSNGPQSSLMTGLVVTSGAFSTSTTAANIEDGSGDIQLSPGQILQVYSDVAMRINFGGVAASSTVGHYIPAGLQSEFECQEPGTVSIVDVA